MSQNPCKKAFYLELWRRLLPPGYTSSIEDEAEGSGFDVPSQQGAQWERYEQAANTSQQAYFLTQHSTQTGSPASSAVKASGEVEVTRAAPVYGAITLPLGTIFRAVITDSYGEDFFVGRYLSTAAVIMAEGDSGPHTIPVEAEWAGYGGNIPDGYITEFQELGRADVASEVLSTTELVLRAVPGAPTDVFSESQVGRYGRLRSAAPPDLASENWRYPRQVVRITSGGIEFSPALDNASDVGRETVFELEEWADFGLTVEQPLAITGGVPDSLAAAGADRRIGRTPGETDASFAQRIQELPDTISPNAIERIVTRILEPFGVAFEIRETRLVEGLMGWTWDLHAYDFGGLKLLKPGGSEWIGEGTVWLDERMGTRFFLVCVERELLSFIGLVYDTAPNDSPNAYDLTGTGVDSGAYDGYDTKNANLMARLREAVDAARAAGVAFDIVIDPNL